VIKPVLAPCGREEELPEVSHVSLTHRGAAVRCAPTDVRRHFAAVSIYQAQYPLVAGFAGRLAQDHAEQEFTDGLRDLLDRLATHPGGPVQVG